MPEWVKDGKTGLLIKRAKEVPYYQEGIRFSGPMIPQFKQAIKVLDPEMVEDLVEKASTLIEDSNLRRIMGEAARWEIEHGEHSIEYRNEVLKKVFDEVCEGAIS